MAFINTQGIKEISFHIERILHCPLGQDNYTAKFDVEIEEPKYIPDYMDVQRWFDEMDGKEFIIEDAVQAVRKMLIAEVREYFHMEVSCTSENAHHFPVTVRG